MYDSWEYAHSRLNGTIVRLGDKPVYIMEVGPKFTVVYCHLGTDKTHTCKVENLDLEPVTLGFFNTPVGAIYASRQPKREDWRQGLRDNTLNLRPKRSWHTTHTNIAEAIAGVRMPLQAALELSRKGKRMVAFHRYWAVDEGVLFHKWFAVGAINDDGRPMFTTRYEYLESRFMEDVGYVAG